MFSIDNINTVLNSKVQKSIEGKVSLLSSAHPNSFFKATYYYLVSSVCCIQANTVCVFEEKTNCAILFTIICTLRYVQINISCS